MNRRSPPILVSACLAGQRCRYDGQAKSCPKVEALVKAGKAVPFCPEVSGGLSTPRSPAEIQGGTGVDVLDGKGRVINANGQDVTAAYIRGAKLGVELAQRLGVRQAILKDKSPACGTKFIYDGSFQRKLRSGQGVIAAALAAVGIQVEPEK
ncbi:MAG: DUF523 domain-containing protein [bacterium]